MGKKSAFQQEDPILNNNFKYDKRKKERQADRQKLKQIQMSQEQKKRQLKEIQRQVDLQIQVKKAMLLKNYQKSSQQFVKQSMISQLIVKKTHVSNHSKKQAKKIKKNKKKANFISQKESKFMQGTVNIVTDNLAKQPIQQIFHEHFQKQISIAILKRQQVSKATNQVGEQVKKQLRSLFGVSTQDKQDEKRVRQAQKFEKQQENPYNLINQLKKQQVLSIDFHTFRVTKAFAQNIDTLKNINFTKPQVPKLRSLQENVALKKMDQQEDQQSVVMKKMIHNYKDCQFIQNREQSTIQGFRNEVLQHILTHLKLCNPQESNKFDVIQEQPRFERKTQGFNQCKALILTPFVGDCRAIFEIIDHHFVQNPQKGYKVQNRQKFDQEAEDQQDFFRIGISFNHKKKIIKYFTRFQNSDIIVASPVGLITSSMQGSNNHQKTDFSFLSSVQILYIDRAHALMMQNWAHVVQICRNLNRMPKYQSLSVSIDKIRNIFLQLKGRLYRQNIVFTQFNFPELNALKINFFQNWKGCISNIPSYEPVFTQSLIATQHFYKISPKEPKDDLEHRLQFFKRKFWDQLHNKDDMSRVVIFVNSYFQFVKLKAFFERANASAECISQHTKKEKVQSRLAKFNNGVFRILLITERAYYFDICKVKRFNHLYFYSLPKNLFIYTQMIHHLAEQAGDQQEQKKVIGIYTQFDQMIIERIVGSKKSKEMMTQYCNNVSFII